MSLFKSVCEFSLKPASYSEPILEQAKIAQINLEKPSPTCFDSFKVRMLSIAQLIMSIVALPIILIVGLIAAGINAILGDYNQDLDLMWMMLKVHVIVMIPTSAVGIFAPLTTTADVGVAQMKCLLNTTGLKEAFEQAQQ